MMVTWIVAADFYLEPSNAAYCRNYQALVANRGQIISLLERMRVALNTYNGRH